MPLLDHFHPPLSEIRPWSGFHHLWAGAIALDLNSRMPDGFIAQPFARFGIEIDVAALDDSSGTWQGQSDLDRRWLASVPTATIPFAITTDEIEIHVFRTRGGLSLAGAIELVSPANKDRPTQRDAFNAKCESYLRAGLGVVVVDIVTDRLANLHLDLLVRLKQAQSISEERSLTATSYRPILNRLDIWRERLEIGSELPELPLWLKEGPCLTVDLATPYRQILAGLKIESN